MTRISALFSIPLLLAAAACGKGAAEPPSGGSAAADKPSPTAVGSGKPDSKCQFTVKGDLTANVSAAAKRTGDPHMSAGSDYWLSEDDLRSAIKTMTGLFNKKSAEEKAREVEEGMKKDPRLVVLLMSCGVDNVGSVILGSGNSPYADVPYGPGKYDIVNDKKNGKQFSLMFSLRQDGQHYFFKLAEPGVLDITRFDKTGLAGTFAFKAVAKDKNVEVAGSFDYACSGSKCK
jgi:hypothetical protein